MQGNRGCERPIWEATPLVPSYSLFKRLGLNLSLKQSPYTEISPVRNIRLTPAGNSDGFVLHREVEPTIRSTNHEVPSIDNLITLAFPTSRGKKSEFKVTACCGLQYFRRKTKLPVFPNSEGKESGFISNVFLRPTALQAKNEYIHSFPQPWEKRIAIGGPL